MTTTYRFVVQHTCPTNPATLDTYELSVTLEGMQPVEQLMAAVTDLLSKALPAYQEDLTQAVANLLGWPVTSTGTHSSVHVTCLANPMPA